MITGWQDVVGYGVIAVMFVAFLLMFAGYAILVRQALRSSDRKRMLRLIFGSVEHQEELNPRGRQLIYTGAAIGGVIFAGLAVLYLVFCAVR